MATALRVALFPSLAALFGRSSEVRRVRAQLGQGASPVRVATVQGCPHCPARRPARPPRWWPLERFCRHCGGTGVATVWRRELPAVPGPSVHRAVQ